MAGGSPPAHIAICESPDRLQTVISVTSTKMAGGNPPADPPGQMRESGSATESGICDGSGIRKVDRQVCHKTNSYVFG